MAKRGKGKPGRRAKATRSARARTASGRSAKRPNRKAAPKRRPIAADKAKRATKRPPKRAVTRIATRSAASVRKPAAARRKTIRPAGSSRTSAGIGAKTPRLDRVRRVLDETVQTPPSSLDMERHGSAVRTGRAEVAESLEDHRGMSPSITGGDVDVDVEDAYFTGDEAPGGDNPTPDQDIVDNIGKALGVQYDDNEELKGSDKVVERDRHRWEMDPASSEDYKDRK